MDPISFYYREAATKNAAITNLANEFHSKLVGSSTKQDREALARLMISFPSNGRVDIGPHTVTWTYTDDDTGVSYAIN